jgi:lysophospholipase L1-like esterase
MVSPLATEPRRASRARKLAISIASLFAFLALVEGALRVRQYAKYGTLGQMHAFVVDAASGLEIPPPGRTTANFAVNERGFRGPLLELPKPAGRVRLAFLGASTTFCAEATSEQATWPALVAAGAASDRANGSVDYLNAGVGGHLLEHMRVNLEKRVAPYEPDVVFLYEATNELTRDTRELAVEQGVYTGHSDRASLLGEYSLAWYLIEKNLLLGRRRDGATRNAARVQFEPRELSRGYRARLEALCDAARARAKLVVLLTFSTQARREHDPARLADACNTAFYYMPYMTPELLLDGFDEYNRVAREVAAEKGVLLVDVAHAVPGDKQHFNDSVHFKDAGCAAFAAAVLERLRAEPRWRAILDG